MSWQKRRGGGWWTHTHREYRARREKTQRREARQSKDAAKFEALFRGETCGLFGKIVKFQMYATFTWRMLIGSTYSVKNEQSTRTSFKVWLGGMVNAVSGWEREKLRFLAVNELKQARFRLYLSPSHCLSVSIYLSRCVMNRTYRPFPPSRFI